MPCKTRKKKRKTYYVTKDVGRPGHHYIVAKYKGKRGKGKYVASSLKKYKRKKK